MRNVGKDSVIEAWVKTLAEVVYWKHGLKTPAENDLLSTVQQVLNQGVTSDDDADGVKAELYQVLQGLGIRVSNNEYTMGADDDELSSSDAERRLWACWSSLVNYNKTAANDAASGEFTLVELAATTDTADTLGDESTTSSDLGHDSESGSLTHNASRSPVLRDVAFSWDDEATTPSSTWQRIGTSASSGSAVRPALTDSDLSSSELSFSTQHFNRPIQTHSVTHSVARPEVSPEQDSPEWTSQSSAGRCDNNSGRLDGGIEHAGSASSDEGDDSDDESNVEDGGNRPLQITANAIMPYPADRHRDSGSDSSDESSMRRRSNSSAMFRLPIGALQLYTYSPMPCPGSSDSSSSSS